MSVHFVYAAAAARDRASILAARAIRRLQRGGVPWSLVGRREAVDTSGWHSRAPFTITDRLYAAFRERARTLLYDWTERVPIRGGKRDLLVGHPYPGDGGEVWNRACMEGDFGLRIALFPISHRMAEVNSFFEPYVPRVDRILGIMGSHWYETWDRSPFAHWKEKLVRLDMAIDSRRFPRVKRRFNPPGRRKFLYIGGAGAQKGTHLLSILFGLAPAHRCLWIGTGPGVPNIERRPWTRLEGDALSRLAQECDVFLTMGVSDANPATILEAMAWGFPVCCTPESGYAGMPEIVPMKIEDMRHNREVLDRMQEAPEEVLLAQADRARRLVESEYTWERFTGTVLGAVEAAAREKGIDPWGR
ncbi:MAG: hypothetical protein E4H29_02720 [Deltaproteobacteria bacterium]|nr:MAG: hypothetical protein E4H29_02720 [Deltaproteobacteria bacterium]